MKMRFALCVSVLLTLSCFTHAQVKDSTFFEHENLVGYFNADTLFFATLDENPNSIFEGELGIVFVQHSQSGRRIVYYEAFEGREMLIKYHLVDMTGDNIKEVIALPEDEALMSIYIYQPSFWGGLYHIEKVFKKEAVWLPLPEEHVPKPNYLDGVLRVVPRGKKIDRVEFYFGTNAEKPIFSRLKVKYDVKKRKFISREEPVR